MQSAIKKQQKQGSYEGLSASQLLAILAEKDDLLQVHQKHLGDKDHIILEQGKRIDLLEEYLRLAAVQKFGVSSEKLAFQSDLFDEAEIEVTLSELEEQLPEEDRIRPKKKKRKRGFSDKLPRVKIHLTLTDEEKEGAIKTFFTKVKEELEFIPAQVKVLEYWQEKAVFNNNNGEDLIVAAQRPVHPLGKCFASPTLLAYIIASKYADGLPLYRLEGMLKRYGGDISRSNMANWIIRLQDTFQPLINLIREVQLEGNYLQADETRIQVLKETGKTAQSDKWMWVIRGGPPDKQSVLFEYDPSRAGAVAERLLDGFGGVLQADGYSGYSKVCRSAGITRIGCFDHARRKFVEASRAAEAKGTPKKAGQPTKADVALNKIRRLYAIEKSIKDLEHDKKKQARQKLSVPMLEDLKPWLEKNVSRVPKDSLTHKAINYTLNQWEYLIGYCEDGQLNISNALAENAIRPFAVGRRAWLFADTSHGARASATCYSLVESAKANGLEPYAYLHHVLAHIAAADTLEKLEALLPWNLEAEG
ncbi:MAG: IS66 family transposase [Gammaproteobacteria bacterium]|nr:MAG: IS66 family transposase [Gammaproteobacteria bacterium]